MQMALVVTRHRALDDLVLPGRGWPREAAFRRQPWGWPSGEPAADCTCR